MAFFKVSRYRALVDEAIRVSICNLPCSKATLVSRVEYAKKRYLAYAHYFTDEVTKSIDLETSASVGGSYTGVQPMGFIWSMKPEANQRPGARLLVRDSTQPYQISLEAYADHLNEKNFSYGVSLCNTVIERTYLSENVEKIHIRHGRLRGSLFLPKQAQSAPAVIDLFGMGGGNMEFRAALLAAKGFVTFHVPFFNYDDLPKYYDLQDMTYFEEAVDFLLSHPRVQGDKVGVVGTSKGGEIACLMSCLYPEKIQAVVVINTIAFPTFPKIQYKDFHMDRPTSAPNGGWYQCDKGLIGGPCLLAAPLETVYPMERATANFLLISCEDDYSVPLDTPHKLAERLKLGGRSDNYEIVEYAGAGHLLEPPYSPLCDVAFVQKFGVVYYGGRAEEHHIAQCQFWEKLQHFLRSNLGEMKIAQKL